MNTIEQAREVATRLREDAEQIRKDIYPRYKNPDDLMTEAADTIDALIAERNELFRLYENTLKREFWLDSDAVRESMKGKS